MKWRIADFFVIALVLICALAIWLYPFFTKSGERAIIEQAQVSRTVYLSEDGETQLDGATVRVKNGKIAITQSDCPDKVCVKTGEISKKGETIVCVPNEIVITIEGEQEVDTIAN